MSAQTISEKFKELKPYIVDLVSGMITTGGAGTSATSGLVAHELNGPYHTGTLSASQFPQFGIHAADAAAHHAPVTIDAGLTLVGQTVGLGTPSTLTRTTTNSASGTTHTHAITTSSNPGVAAVILTSDSSGHLTLQSLTLDGSGIALDSALGSLQMAYGVDTTHYLGRAYLGDCGLGGGGYAAFGHADLIGSADYAIAQGSLSDQNTYLNARYGYSIYHRIDNDDIMQMTFQRLNPAGSILKDLGDYNRKWRTLFAAELYVETLVAQSVMATIGGRVMVAPTNKLLNDCASGDTTIDVVYNNFQNGTYIYFSSAPGGIAQIEAMKVTSSATTIAGGYRYTVTRNLDGTGANNWVAGDACVSLGEAVGQGYIDLTSTNTIHNHLGPTIAIYSRTATTSWNSVKPVAAFGNLRSFVDYTGDKFGWAAGNDLTLSPTGGFVGLTGDATSGLRLFNTPIKMYYSGAQFLSIDTTDGFRIVASNVLDSLRSYGFTNTTLGYIGGLGAYYDPVTGFRWLKLNAPTVSNVHSSIQIESYATSSYTSSASLWATNSTYTSSISVQATTTGAYMAVASSTQVDIQTGGVLIYPQGFSDIALKIDNNWSAFPDRNSTSSEISNDVVTFHQLMLVGNTSAGGSRRVGIWDQLQVGGSSFYQTFNVSGGGYFSGNVGIKATSPDRTLQVAGTVHISTYDAAFTTAGWGRPLELENGAAIVWKNSGSGSARGIGSTSDGVLFVMRSTANNASAAATYDMVIDTSGNVAIGTASSASGLTVAAAVSETALGYDNIRLGTLSGTPRIMFEDAGSTIMAIDNSAGTMRFYKPGTVLMTLDTSGNLAVGGTLYVTSHLGAWNAISYGTGWTDYGSGWQSVHYRKFGDIVYVRGLAKRTSGSGTTIATLPSGYRPPNSLLFPVYTDAGAGRVDIDTSGNISLVAGGTGYVSLNFTISTLT